ncbi:phosphatidylinositol N-acetylglucosaminyltransferase subunit A-like [Ptychodera flava]|uniref:phosphatidylinositol N-acetylglucosaminyltransferase subunit A-like n=1 Tax=Ptychodera flava TaxID=63121 RepID=UPI00396A667C
MQFAKRADVVFSVGPRIYKHYDGKFRRLKNVVHKQYIPYPDDGFFDLEITPPEPDHPMRILTVGRIDGVAHLKGYDIIAEALSKVCKQYDELGMPLPKWDIRGIPEDKFEESKEFIDKHISSKYLQCIPHPYGTQKQIMEDLKQSHLFIMPSRSEPFGMVGMEAIAAGLPVLVTRHSGLADFIEEHFNIDAERMVVDVGLNDYAREKDVDIWRKRIINALISKNMENNFSKAAEMKEKLQCLCAIPDTHKEFQKMLKGN